MSARAPDLDAACVLPMLGSDMTVALAAQWAQAWRDALPDGPGDVVVPLAGVTDIDSSGVQLLVATRRRLQAQGAELHLQTPSAPVREALQTLGLAHWLGATPPSSDASARIKEMAA